MLNNEQILVLLSFFLIKVDINSLTIPTFTANFVENRKKSYLNV
jgi:general stress protein CsbA